MRKYEITDIQHPDNANLHRIKALVDIPGRGVKAGDLGGYIQSENNLSQDGNGWVSGNGRVTDNGKVTGNGWVTGYGLVAGYGLVTDNGLVADNGWVSGNGRVTDNGRVIDNGSVTGNGKVTGNGRVAGYGRVFGDAMIKKPTDILTISSLGSRNATLTVLYNKTCATGCFQGTIDEFLAAVKKIHGNNEYAKLYYKAINFAYEYFDWERV